MPLFSTRRHHNVVTTTHTTVAPRRRGLFSAPRRRRAAPVAVPVAVHHHKRHATIGDKISGALLRLKGTLTGRPGQKVCPSHTSSYGKQSCKGVD